jgi:hypothetical protein
MGWKCGTDTRRSRRKGPRETGAFRLLGRRGWEQRQAFRQAGSVSCATAIDLICLDTSCAVVVLLANGEQSLGDGCSGHGCWATLGFCIISCAASRISFSAQWDCWVYVPGAGGWRRPESSRRGMWRSPRYRVSRGDRREPRRKECVRRSSWRRRGRGLLPQCSNGRAPPAHWVGGLRRRVGRWRLRGSASTFPGVGGRGES